uniref:UTP4 small subunit processome component n=1 Tax=Oryzias sinensis TaxID=183150 RepID=A0A8C7ZHY2_9TELE
MGEFVVHRVRFFDYMPSAIRAMAFNGSTQRLAVARGDGAVEIFNFADNYFQEKVIPGRSDRAIEALCWVRGRLFSAGLSGEIIEYDLEKLRPRYSVEAYGGPIWTISSNSQETLLGVGCEDGTVKMFEILEERIQFQRNLDRQKGRIISLSWHPSGAQIAAGMIDMIRIFDAETGKSTLKRSSQNRTAPKTHVVVWSVAFLSNDTVISGDSAGKVQIWDAVTGTLIRNHLITKWDVLGLAVSQDESSVIAGTSEGTVVQFQALASTMGQENNQWVRTRTFKNHTHDVRALVHTDTAVVSGGMDTQLVVRPLLDKVEKNTQESALRKILFPHKSLVCCARKAGLLLFQFPDHLELWRLGESRQAGDRLPVMKNPEKLIQLQNKGEDHICCSAVSPCGSWVAFSTVSSVRLYKLQLSNGNISIKKMLLRAFSAFLSFPGSSQPIHLLSASENGNWLAAANTDGQIHVFNLHKLKVSSYLFLHCTLPVYSSCPTAIAIHPTTGHLLSAHADQQIFEFSLKLKEYTAWSRSLQREGLHPLWLQRDTPITHIAFNRNKPAHVFLHDAFMFCIIDQSLPLPQARKKLYNQMDLKTISPQKRMQESHAFKICKMFQHLLSIHLLDDSSLVVVERPLADIVSQLPPPVRQKKFAT